jgi:hypothetical protein
MYNQFPAVINLTSLNGFFSLLIHLMLQARKLPRLHKVFQPRKLRRVFLIIHKARNLHPLRKVLLMQANFPEAQRI